MAPIRETRKPSIPAVVAKRLEELLERGRFSLPDPSEHKGYGGAGGPGRWLEHLLGLDGGNADMPDSGKWEVKSHSGKSLLTLFHQEHSDGMLIQEICEKWGIASRGGRCFRHTVRGDRWSTGPRIAGFRLEPNWSVVYKAPGFISNPVTEVVRWDPDRVVSHLAQKLRRLIYVHIEPMGAEVLVHAVTLWWDPRVTALGDLVEKGLLRVDFDACIREDAASTYPDRRVRRLGANLRVFASATVQGPAGRDDEFPRRV